MADLADQPSQARSIQPKRLVHDGSRSAANGLTNGPVHHSARRHARRVGAWITNSQSPAGSLVSLALRRVALPKLPAQAPQPSPLFRQQLGS